MNNYKIMRCYLLLWLSVFSLCANGQQLTKESKKESYTIYKTILDEFSDGLEDIYGKKVEFSIIPIIRDNGLRTYDFKQEKEETKENVIRNRIYDKADWRKFLTEVDTNMIPDPWEINFRKFRPRASYTVKKYPQVAKSSLKQIVLKFSPVLFSNDCSKAVCSAVYAPQLANESSGTIYFFEKKSGKWEMVHGFSLYLR